MTSELTVAIHAAVYLAHKNAPQSSDELAVNICTHPVRVRKIMAALCRAGIAVSQEGSEGGYRLCRSPAGHHAASDCRSAECCACGKQMAKRRSGNELPGRLRHGPGNG